MSTINAISDGKFSSKNTWEFGKIPGKDDIVYSGEFIIEIDKNVKCGKLIASCGGKFIINSIRRNLLNLWKKRIIEANIFNYGSETALLCSNDRGNVIVKCDIITFEGIGIQNNKGNLTITGNLVAQGNNSYGVNCCAPSIVQE